MKTILVPPGNDWDWLMLRTNHFMREFAKHGWKVYWCNRSTIGSKVIEPHKVEKNIYVCCLGEWPKSEEEIVDILGFDNVDVTFTNYPFWSNVPHHVFPIERSVTCFDYIDYVDEWVNWEIHAIENADVVTTISSSLKQHLATKHPVKRDDAVHIRNACDFEFLNKDIQPVPEFEELQHPIVGYIGSTAFWWDKEAFREILQHFTAVHVGIQTQSVPYGTISFVYQPYKRVRDFIHGLDCGVHCTTNSITALMGSPLKIYDYLGCGIPVVCTENKDIEESLSDLVSFVPVFGNYVKPIKKEIENDSEDKREARRDRMREETWDKRYEQLISLIEEKL